METKIKMQKQTKPTSTAKQGPRDYYFHPDEDFREDWDWGKAKKIAGKALSKRTNQYEI